VPGTSWSVLAPQPIYEAICRYRPTELGGENGEDGPLLGTAETSRNPVFENLDRAEDTEFHR
jgi:hypothetical protein